MDFGLQELDYTDVENTLCQIREVKAARFVLSRERQVEELHVLASTGKNPRQLVRDIESALMASYGLAIDHKKISIAQLGREDISQESLRPRIISVRSGSSGTREQVAVVLEMDGRELMGEAEGPASQTGRLRLLAQATLNAVVQFGENFSFALEDVHIVPMGHERVAVSCVVLVTPMGEHSFSGSAVVRQNEKDSVVRATLDALNRRLGFLTTQ
ncbi:MAG: hypothetical protein C4521_03150 [Actinobacteria bacterium]|nr:MAG: hypothetical protein C4521_03150 [Actinomycetota bacterium]